MDAAALESALRQAGTAADREIDLAGTALLLAALDRPQVPLDRYRAHLAEIADDMRLGGGRADIAGAADTLRQVVCDRHGYAGDRLTYDDPQNANLMRVIDRRKGLPVALGILFIHAGRAAGWEIGGVAFPAHFLVRLEVGGQRALIDPFDDVRLMDAGELRRMVKRFVGPEAELSEAHYRPAGNRGVLLRLQNNIKLRALQAGDAARAARVLASMLWIAPDNAALWRELGLVEAAQGNLGAAIAAVEAYRDRAVGEAPRHDAAALLQQLRSRLN